MTRGGLLLALSLLLACTELPELPPQSQSGPDTLSLRDVVQREGEARGPAPRVTDAEARARVSDAGPEAGPSPGLNPEPSDTTIAGAPETLGPDTGGDSETLGTDTGGDSETLGTDTGGGDDLAQPPTDTSTQGQDSAPSMGDAADASADDAGSSADDATPSADDASADGSENASEVTSPQPQCGDGLCSEGESHASCSQDCPPLCGDGLCSEGESHVSCSQDCPPLCGDGLCSEGESHVSCSQDCPPLCGDGLCSQGEDAESCALDCEGVSCAEIPAPEAPAFAPHPGAAPGTWETTTVDGFTDDYLVRADGELKIGIRREWGASIIFFGFSGEGPGTNSTNTIDSHDTGREVQVAFYDATRIVQGCAHDASCVGGAGPCINSITFLGWNPVQGGNECNNGSGVEWVNASQGALSSETIPLFWNPNWESVGCDNGGCSDPQLNTYKSDVSYTQSLRWVSDHVVEMTMSVQNLSALDHPVTLQEFPTLYATFGHQNTPDLHVIMNALGEEISVDQPANDGFFYKAFESPGGWAALQNSDKSYGVGLYYENELGDFQGWQKPQVFNNIRSKFPFAIPAFGRVQGRAYLVLGGFGTIAAEVAELQSTLAPFGILESPAPEAILGASTVELKGWALDNRGVSEIRVLIDGATVQTSSTSVPRPDVCSAWPLYPDCPAPGFSLDLDLTGLSPCPHLLEIEAVDSDGNARVIARQRINVGQGGGASACGDGVCSEGEDSQGCPADCGPSCGDGVCSPGETCPEECEAEEQGTVLLHRYLYASGGDQDHMFGVDTAPPAGYSYEGPAFHLYTSEAPGLQPLYQSYCAACTDHLQGTSPNEGAPAYTGHTLLGYVGSAEGALTPNPLQRVYGAAQSDHFVTGNADEVNALQSSGYALEALFWTP